MPMRLLPLQLQPGAKKYSPTKFPGHRALLDSPPALKKPVQKWEINGTEYSYADSGSDAYYIELSDDFDATIAQTFIELGLGRRASGQNWTIKPIGTQSGFKATVDVADKTQGSVSSVENTTNEF